MPKQAGDSVFGSTVNQSGVILVRATGVGKDSAVSQIVGLVSEAQTSRPPMQDFVDKVSSVFVPFVVGIALLTLLVRGGRLTMCGVRATVVLYVWVGKCVWKGVWGAVCGVVSVNSIVRVPGEALC